MKRVEIRFPAIILSFFLMGIFADLLPHPALGPGLIHSFMGTFSTAEESSNEGIETVQNPRSLEPTASDETE